MDRRLLILSGTPASGKDSVTDALIAHSDRFVRLKKHRSGEGGRQDDTYTQVTSWVFRTMVRRQAFAQWHARYDRLYGVSWTALDAAWAAGKIPVIHNGRPIDAQALLNLPGVLARHVVLLCSEPATRRRLALRSAQPGFADDADARLKAYAEERDELTEMLRSCLPAPCDLCLNTERVLLDEAVRLIAAIW